MRRRLRVALAVAAAVAATTAGSSGPAWAHITVEPPEAAPGSYATVSFRVPNERPDVATTKVRVQLPPDHPMASVLVRPVPGWTVTLETRAPEAEQDGNVVETVSVITWEGGRIEPGFYESFEVNLGPLPDDVELLSFPAIQYYEDGEEVAWIERPSVGAPVPELPAPGLALVGTAGGSRDAHGQVVDGAEVTSAAGTTGGSDDDSSSATAIASFSLGVAVVALGAAAVAWFLVLRHRRRTGPPPAATG